MPSTVRTIATAAVTLLFASCASAGSEPGARERSRAPTVIQVTNNNWSDMRIYVVYGGTRVRLGTVSTTRTEIFRLPSTLDQAAGRLQLVADPIGSREIHMTQPVNIVAGQRVSFQVENHLAISTVSVW